MADIKKNKQSPANGEKQGYKKVFTNDKSGANVKDGNKQFKKTFKSDDSKGAQGGNKDQQVKVYKKNFKTTGDNATGAENKDNNGNKFDKKFMKGKEKFDKKAKRVFGAQGGENEESEGDSILFTEINVKVNKIQNAKTTQEEKEKLINQIIKKLSGVLKQVVHKRDGSRSVQACIKNGNEEQREQIFNILLDSKELDEIIKSKYGHYTALRMIKFLKNKTTKERFFEVIKKNAFYLVTHVEGAKVLDKFVINLATPAQFNTLKKLFSQKLEDAANLKQEETIENIAAKIIDKSNHNPILSKHILSLSLPILIPVERERVIEYLREKILDLIDSKEGIRLALDVINYSQPKDKKILAKNFKDHFCEIINTQSSQAFVIIIKLLFSWDDTVQANKQIFAEIRPQLDEILPTRNGIAFFSALFQPKFNALISYEKEVKMTTSKKPLDQKLNELIEYILDDLIKSIPKIPEETLYKDFSASRFLSSIIRYIFIHAKKQHYDFAFSHLEKLVKDGESFFSSEEKKAKFNDECLLSHHDSHRIMKNIIMVVKDVSDRETHDQIVEKINGLADLLLKNIKTVITSRATYLLVALIENDISKQKVLDVLKKEKTLLQKQGDDNKGADLLKSLIP